MRIALFDTRVGNLHSLAKALEAGGTEVRIEADPLGLLDADGMVIPGVGAFNAAAERLAPAAAELRTALQNGYPMLGICLGMQLLFEKSEEGSGDGLGVVSGTVRRLRTSRVPHMGWNEIEAASASDPLFAGLDALVAYYANSFVGAPADEADVTAWTRYEDERFPAAVRRHNAWGVQFHPEKSGEAGLAVIRNFLAEVGR